MEQHDEHGQGNKREGNKRPRVTRGWRNPSTAKIITALLCTNLEQIELRNKDYKLL
jgi:hypothetical protein